MAAHSMPVSNDLEGSSLFAVAMSKAAFTFFFPRLPSSSFFLDLRISSFVLVFQLSPFVFRLSASSFVFRLSSFVFLLRLSSIVFLLRLSASSFVFRLSASSFVFRLFASSFVLRFSRFFFHPLLHLPLLFISRTTSPKLCRIFLILVVQFAGMAKYEDPRGHVALTRHVFSLRGPKSLSLNRSSHSPSHFLPDTFICLALR